LYFHLKTGRVVARDDAAQASATGQMRKGRNLHLCSC
jgi:hypothetical protein